MSAKKNKIPDMFSKLFTKVYSHSISTLYILNNLCISSANFYNFYITEIAIPVPKVLWFLEHS